MDNSKKKSKYRNLLVLYLLYVVFWIIILTILRLIFKPPAPIALSRFVPLDDVFIELAFIFIIIFPFSGLIGLLLGGYLITPIILYLHKKIYGSKMHYGIQQTSDSGKIKFFSKGFFPMLMAINLSSILLTPEVIQFILSANLITEIKGIENLINIHYIRLEINRIIKKESKFLLVISAISPPSTKVIFKIISVVLVFCKVPNSISFISPGRILIGFLS